jgi:hypothetical protein
VLSGNQNATVRAPAAAVNFDLLEIPNCYDPAANWARQ